MNRGRRYLEAIVRNDIDSLTDLDDQRLSINRYQYNTKKFKI